MRKIILLLSLMLLAAIVSASDALNYKANFVNGDPGIASINAMAFGPQGILFIGDSKNAAIYAVDTQDAGKRETAEEISMNKVDIMIAEALGTDAGKVFIQDMAVNPTSKTLYLAVHHEDGTPVLMKLIDGKFEWVPLDDVSYSKKKIEGVVAPDIKDDRGRPLRIWTISDLNYLDGKVMVTGLSNKEFSSVFRSMLFPFRETQSDASLEIYHAAHGQYETHSPVKTFTTATINGKKHLVASYTCTPLVIFPIDALKEGAHTKGRTVAELGNWNTPLDMIVMEKDGHSYLIMANSNRSVMKIDFADIENFEGSLSEPVEERSATAGVEFIALPWVHVLQLDKLDDKQFVMLKRESNGDLSLVTQGERWL